MRCEELMKTHVECVRPQDSVQDAARIMRDKGIGFLPVCDVDRRVLGTITDRDIVIRCVAGERPITSVAVEDVMTREVVSCGPEDDVDTCEELMATHRKSRIMICDDDERLIGVISLSDIAQHDRSRKAGKTLRKVTKREAQKAL
jgi:CBS domain-containing protein